MEPKIPKIKPEIRSSTKEVKIFKTVGRKYLSQTSDLMVRTSLVIESMTDLKKEKKNLISQNKIKLSAIFELSIIYLSGLSIQTSGLSFAL